MTFTLIDAGIIVFFVLGLYSMYRMGLERGYDKGRIRGSDDAIGWLMSNQDELRDAESRPWTSMEWERVEGNRTHPEEGEGR